MASLWVLLTGGLLGLGIEILCRIEYETGSHLLGQRLSEWHGHMGIFLLLVVLLARPLGWIRVRRPLGLLAFFFSALHVYYAFIHTLGGQLAGLSFLIPTRQIGIWLGILPFVILTLMAISSNDRMMKKWGGAAVHRCGVGVALLASLHTLMIGVHYGFSPPRLTTLLFLTLLMGVFTLRRQAGR